MGGDGEGAYRRRGVEMLETRRDGTRCQCRGWRCRRCRYGFEMWLKQMAFFKCERQIWRRPQEERSNMTPMGARVPKGR